MIGLIVTALSIARERELGTFDQLMVSPLAHARDPDRQDRAAAADRPRPRARVYVLAAVFFFRVPLRGSLFLLYGSAVFYLAALVGVGLFISALSATQQQAILGAFLFMVPATCCSRASRRRSRTCRQWLQPVTLVNPLRYFLVIVKGVFLKDIPVEEVVRQTVPLVLISIATLGAAAWLFRRRLE